MAHRGPDLTSLLGGLGPGAFCLLDGPNGTDLALVVSREGRREVLVLNRRRKADGDLPLLSNLAVDAVVVLLAAFVAPSGAVDPAASVSPRRVPGALYLTAAGNYLCGRDEFGRLATFDAASGLPGAINAEGLPQAVRWRVMVPQAGGVVTVYEAEPA